MYNNRSKGFTLIELLVVIAIIGILSAVVLASLNTARQKGNDAAIQSNLNTIQTQAEIYYGDNSNTYGGADSTGDCGASGTMFVGNTTISSALAQAKTANGNVALKCYVATGGTAFGPSVARRIVGFYLESTTRFAQGAFPELTTREREVLDLLLDLHRGVEPAFFWHVAEATAYGEVDRRASPQHAAAVEIGESEDRSHRGRLAGAIRAEEAGHLSGLDGEAQPIQRLSRTEAAPEVTELECHRSARAKARLAANAQAATYNAA